MCQTNFRFNFRTAAHQSRRFAKPLYASPPPVYILADPLYPAILANGVPFTYPRLFVASRVCLTAARFRLVSGLCCCRVCDLTAVSLKTLRNSQYTRRVPYSATVCIRKSLAPYRERRQQIFGRWSVFVITTPILLTRRLSRPADRRLSPALVSLAVPSHSPPPPSRCRLWRRLPFYGCKAVNDQCIEFLPRKSATPVTAESYERARWTVEGGTGFGRFPCARLSSSRRGSKGDFSPRRIAFSQTAARATAAAHLRDWTAGGN